MYKEYPSNSTTCLKFTIDIDRKFQCVCQPCSKDTQIQTSDVVSGLLKYNSSLTKYLARYQAVPNNQNLGQKQSKQRENQGTDPAKNNQNQQKSIIQLYNLRVLPPGSHLPPPEPKPQPIPTKISPQKVQFQTQTSPRNQANNQNANKKPKPVPGSNQDKIEKHMKQLAASSRYLPNSGFKKYFGRQCFQNYGRQNTTGVADGIVYGNYMKTFNISPHCGNNLPITEQTYKQSLITGNPKNYNQPKIPQSHHNNKTDRQNAEGFLKKGVVDMQTIKEQSQRHQKQQANYTIKLSKQKRNQNGMTAGEAKHVKQAIKYINQREKEQNLHIFDPFRKNTKNNQNSKSSTKNLHKNPQAIQDRQIPLKRNQYEQQQIQSSGNLNQISQISPRQYRQNHIQGDYDRNNRGRYQKWDANNQQTANHIRMQKKKQILQQCYKSSQISHAINPKNKVNCQICANRRFTKCCCVA